MNVLKGIIEKVRNNKSLTLVRIKVGKKYFSSIVIDTIETAPYLVIGSSVSVIFKESEVIIGKGLLHNISLQNKLEGNIHSIESGELLSRLVIDTEVGKITSIITNNAVSQLHLDKGSEVTAMIKTNEIMLAE